MKGVKAQRRVFKAGRLAVVLTLFIVFSFILAGLAKADLGVSNDPPAWVGLRVHEVTIDDTDYIAIDLAIKDLNGWIDIYNATATIFDGRGNVITRVQYSQYSDLNATTPIASWSETTGNYLIVDESSFSPVEIAPWNWENAQDMVGLNITFVLESFSGDTIKVDIFDKKMAKSEYSGPFSAEYEIPPYFGSNYIYPISISSIVAAIVAVIFTIRRHYSNKLARTIQAQEKQT